jgi:hypothetical protein
MATPPFVSVRGAQASFELDPESIARQVFVEPATVQARHVTAYFEIEPDGLIRGVEMRPGLISVQGSRGPVGPVGPKGDFYALAISALGQMSDNEVLFRHVFASQVSFPDGFAGSLAGADIPSTGAAVLKITKNGTQVGTITFASSDIGMLSGAGPIQFNAGDVLRIHAPTPPNPTLTDISITLLGERVEP